MGPIWGPPVANRTQVGPMLAPWSLLSGKALCELWLFWLQFHRNGFKLDTLTVLSATLEQFTSDFLPISSPVMAMLLGILSINGELTHWPLGDLNDILDR